MNRNAKTSWLLLAPLLSAVLLLETGCPAFRPQRYPNFVTPTPVAENSYLIVGFMSGLEAWDKDRPVRKFALRLRAMNLPGVHVETVENWHWRLAVRLIRNALDRNQDGKLDEQERASARVILYGHSWGGAAVVKTARRLKKMGVPVLLTVQTDSVGIDDNVIPSNVARAVNFYQDSWVFVRGRSRIRAEDPQKTTILGSFRCSYRNKKVDRSGLFWPIKVLGGDHMKLAFDPDVWAQIEALVLREIQPPAGPRAASPARR